MFKSKDRLRGHSSPYSYWWGWSIFPTVELGRKRSNSGGDGFWFRIAGSGMPHPVIEEQKKESLIIPYIYVHILAIARYTASNKEKLHSFECHEPSWFSFSTCMYTVYQILHVRCCCGKAKPRFQAPANTPHFKFSRCQLIGDYHINLIPTTLGSHIIIPVFVVYGVWYWLLACSSGCSRPKAFWQRI